MESTFTDNSAPSGGGGAILTRGFIDTFTVMDSTYMNNTANQGGAIFTGDSIGTLDVMNSNFTGNSALDGGAIFFNFKPTVFNETDTVDHNGNNFTNNMPDNIAESGYYH